MQIHPSDKKGKSFSICANIRFYGLCSGCRESKEISVDDITDAERALGIGPALMLKSTMSMAFLFLFLTILNLPVYAFYYSGNISTNEAGQESLKVSDYFAMISLGNIG